MKKENISKYNSTKLFHKGEGSILFDLKDGRLLKVLSSMVREINYEMNIDYEARILDTRANVVSEIVCPLSAVYFDNECIGYTMERIKGIDLYHYDDSMPLNVRADLNYYYDLYSKIENVVKKANEIGIVMPDLCTASNIIVTKDKNVKFIDYDGMQVGSKDRSIALSTELGNPDEYVYINKFHSGNFHFTTELDKKSLTIILFLLIFNADIGMVGKINPNTFEIVSLDDIFNWLELDDVLFYEHVKANLSPFSNGYYLGDDLRRIVNNYEMEAIQVEPGSVMKRLIRK